MLITETIARVAITAGGIGTILAVTMIFVFLAWVVAPLFLSPSIAESTSFAAERSTKPLGMGVDEERRISWTLHDDGGLELHDLGSGRRIEVLRPFGGVPPISASFNIGREDVVFGFADGTVRLGKLGFVSDFPDESDVPAALHDLANGEVAVLGDGVVERTTIGQLRRTTLHLELEEPLETGDASPVLFVDHAVTPAGISIATLQADGALRVSRERTKKNLLTGKVTKSLKSVELAPAQSEDPEEVPVAILVGGLGQHVYVVGKDGTTQHWDLRDFAEPRLFEEIDLLEDPSDRVSAVRFVAGRQTLVVGDQHGNVATWFSAREEGSDDDPLLVRVHTLAPGDSEVVAIAPSPRSRVIAVGFASGMVHVYQATLGNLLLEIEGNERPELLVLPPKEDAILARHAENVATCEVNLGYPEATLAALARPVWYEGYGAPTHVWQSSSASDDFEPKLGLMPLVFGTIKATIYSMLFGAPLAILAALYTSEFLSKRLRSSVKSTVELMASLPSVVLGFIGALVIAPFVQAVLPAVMASFLTVPIATLLGAYLWQMLPQHVALRWAGWQRFVAILLTLPLGIASGALLGSALESLVFAGDVMRWLGGQHGDAWGGWFFLLLPLSALIVALGGVTFLGPLLRRRSFELARGPLARLDALKFIGGIAATIGVSWILALALQALAFDPRGGVVGTYVQRNALIVGFVMGFAVIPIIYTLAEDSLSEVPSALREGSLGAGATRWQTAIRIVLPFAMSGIFSAMMIGLGRAVGETMIVLMAAGNTPIMEWNLFNGFRTLSANIAVELPEAVVGSGHYRTLFLAALVLFALTFVLNTLAELVRRHFRSRFSAL